ncbi:MAG: CoA-binding protein [Thermoplasmata archaeon]|nr:MAG: CoA-binding protein [Thermoplasmata archaeon]
MKKPDIRDFFEPASVAVIGASEKKGKIGYKLMENIINGGYKGSLYPVNPRGEDILGFKTYMSVSDIEGPVDMAVVAIPANFVLEEVSKCAEKGVKFLVIITSGFSEVGNQELERKVITAANSAGMRVLGPNIFGIYSSKVSLNATFGPGDVKPGNAAIITQSGALGIAMIGKTSSEGIGLSTIVSLGNKGDMDETDILDYLANDDSTKVIMAYIEGITNGDKLVPYLKEVTRKKPVIVIKSGRSKRGALAAASHTGSLAGSDEVFDAIMRQCGVLRAENLDEAFNWMKFLGKNPTPKSERGVIITNGGGIGVMATDACEKYDIPLLDEPELLKKTFSEIMPSFGSTRNPIDITGQASSTDYQRALMKALESDSIDFVMSLYCQTSDFDRERYSEMLRLVYNEFKTREKPIGFSLVGGEEVERCVDELGREGIPIFKGVYELVSCFGALVRYRRTISAEPSRVEDMDIGTERIERIIDNALEDGRDFLLSYECKEVLSECGLPTARGKIVTGIREAVEVADEIGYPVVMKVVSRDVLHKSDAGGVALDLSGREEVMDAYQLIMRNVKDHNPHAKIEGIEVSEMIPQGLETIVGGRRDPSFGPIIMFGLGGIYVEIMKDVSFRALPIDRKEAVSLMKEIRSYPLLLGVRGEKSKDTDALIDVMLKVGALLRKVNRISDIEINPLFVYERGNGVKVVDIRIMIRKEREVEG